MADFDVAAVGDNCIDRYLPPVGLGTVGGNAVNVAVHLRKQGLRSAYLGAVGPDRDGRRVLDCLSHNRVAVDHVQVNEGISAFTELDIDGTGDRAIRFEEFGVCRTYRPSEADFRVLLGLRHVHIGWLDDGGDLRRKLAAAGASVSQDMAVNSGAEGLTIAFGSAGSDRHAAVSIANGYLSAGAALAVVTRGAAGSLATDGRIMVETGILPVDVADTTGAGDTFIAGFIARRLAGGTPQECLDAARDAAAVTCTHFGGFRQTPWRLWAAHGR